MAPEAMLCAVPARAARVARYTLWVSPVATSLTSWLLVGISWLELTAPLQAGLVLVTPGFVGN